MKKDKKVSKVFDFLLGLHGTGVRADSLKDLRKISFDKHSNGEWVITFVFMNKSKICPGNPTGLYARRIIEHNISMNPHYYEFHMDHGKGYIDRIHVHIESEDTSPSEYVMTCYQDSHIVFNSTIEEFIGVWQDSNKGTFNFLDARMRD